MLFELTMRKNLVDKNPMNDLNGINSSTATNYYYSG